MPTGVPSARQQATPVIMPSAPMEMAFIPPPMHFTRLLRRHGVIDEIDDGLERGWEDAQRPWQPQRVQHAPPVRHHHGRHRGEHPLARRDGQGAPGMRVEVIHVVVGDEPCARDHDGGAEQAVDRVRGAHDMAVGIGDCDMGRVRRLPPA
jgi:hypothetical protein